MLAREDESGIPDGLTMINEEGLILQWINHPGADGMHPRTLREVKEEITEGPGHKCPNIGVAR